MALDVKTHNVYLATAQFHPTPEAAPRAAPEKGEKDRNQPAMFKDSFTILIVGKQAVLRICR